MILNRNKILNIEKKITLLEVKQKRNPKAAAKLVSLKWKLDAYKQGLSGFKLIKARFKADEAIYNEKMKAKIDRSIEILSLQKDKNEIKIIELKKELVFRKDRFKKIIPWVAAMFVLVCAFSYFPIFRTLIDAFQQKAGFVVVKVFTLDNFTRLFAGEEFRKSLINTVLYSFLATPISIAISFVIASSLAGIVRKRLRSSLQAVFFVPYVTSAVAIALTFMYIFNFDYGLLNFILSKFGIDAIQWISPLGSFRAMLIFGVWGSLAFNILIITTAILGIDKTSYAAASIDGASKFKQARTITLPLVFPTIIFLVTMGFINGIKFFPLALFGSDAEAAVSNGGYTLVLYIYRLTKISEWDRAAAASIVLFVIALAMTQLVKILRKLVTK